MLLFGIALAVLLVLELHAVWRPSRQGGTR
jgi:hypothetical protein